MNKKKSPATKKQPEICNNRTSLIFLVALIFQGDNRNIGPIVFLFPEFDDAVGCCKKCMIDAHADVKPRMMNGASLADNNISCCCELATKYFYS